MSVEAIGSMIGFGLAFVLYRMYKASRKSVPTFDKPAPEDMAHLIEPPDDFRH